MQQSNELQSVAGLTGEPRHISAAGVTRQGQRIITLENTSPFDPSTTARRRVVVVADNDRAVRATLAAIRWFKTDAPRNVRDQWSLSAVLLSHENDATPAQQLEFPPAKGFFDYPEQPESRYLWRQGGVSGARPRAAYLRGYARPPPARRRLRGGDGGVGPGNGACRCSSGCARADRPHLPDAFDDAPALSEVRSDAEGARVAKSRSRSPVSWRVNTRRLLSSATSRRLHGSTRFGLRTSPRMMRSARKSRVRRVRGSRGNSPCLENGLH